MGADALLAAIRSESEAEVDRILDDARSEADRLVAEGRAELARNVAEALAAAGPELAAEAVRRVNLARLRLLHARARRRADRVAAVFDAADAEVRALVAVGSPRWQQARTRLERLAGEAIGPDGVPVAGDDETAIRARSSDGAVTVDASVGTRLARARTVLADTVAELLGSG